MCYPCNSKYVRPERLNSADFVDILEIMSESVSRSLVDMTPNRHHIYTHTCNTLGSISSLPCAERNSHYFLISIIFSASTPNPHPAIYFSPLSQATLIHLHSPIDDFPLSFPLSQGSFSYIIPPFPFSPFHWASPQLLSSLFLIIATLRLPLAALSFSTSALLSPLSLCPGPLPVPRSSADLSPLRLRLA